MVYCLFCGLIDTKNRKAKPYSITQKQRQANAYRCFSGCGLFPLLRGGATCCRGVCRPPLGDGICPTYVGTGSGWQTVGVHYLSATIYKLKLISCRFPPVQIPPNLNNKKRNNHALFLF